MSQKTTGKYVHVNQFQKQTRNKISNNSSFAKTTFNIIKIKEAAYRNIKKNKNNKRAFISVASLYCTLKKSDVNNRNVDEIYN